MGEIFTCFVAKLWDKAHCKKVSVFLRKNLFFMFCFVAPTQKPISSEALRASSDLSFSSLIISRSTLLSSYFKTTAQDKKKIRLFLLIISRSHRHLHTFILRAFIHMDCVVLRFVSFIFPAFHWSTDDRILEVYFFGTAIWLANSFAKLLRKEKLALWSERSS